jgi:hypothetical protein
MTRARAGLGLTFLVAGALQGVLIAWVWRIAVR